MNHSYRLIYNTDSMAGASECGHAHRAMSDTASTRVWLEVSRGFRTDQFSKKERHNWRSNEQTSQFFFIDFFKERTHDFGS